MKNVPDHTGFFVTCSLPYQSGDFVWAVLKKQFGELDLSNTLCALISCVLYFCYFSFKNHHFISAYIVVVFVSMLHQFKFLQSTLCEVMPVFLELHNQGSVCLPSIASVTFTGSAIDIMCNCNAYCYRFFFSQYVGPV